MQPFVSKIINGKAIGLTNIATDGWTTCPRCGRKYHDWQPHECKPRIFEKTYEPVDEGIKGIEKGEV